MKKLILSFGLVLILASPAYATGDDSNPSDEESINGSPSSSETLDAASDFDMDEFIVELATRSDSNEVLSQCSIWNTFTQENENEARAENKESCQESVQEQLDNNPEEDPRHMFYNINGQDSSTLSNGCCYESRLDLNIDENNNCKLETKAEECQLKKNLLEIEKSCICSANPGHEICSQTFRCQVGQSEPTAYSINAFESEFFDVTSPTKGLLSPGQGGSLVAGVDNEQGPIFAVVNRALNIIVGLASTVALVVLIIGAYMLITAQGGENQMEKGKNAIMYSLLGLVFILTSFTIVRLVQSILF